MPTAIFYGGDDWLADPTDVGYIFDQLQSKTLVYRKYIDSYNHMDFIWALDANQLVYSDLMAQMKKFHPPT